MSTSTVLDKILVKLLILDGNETTFLVEDSRETYVLFMELIIALTKIQYDIRFCGRELCPCHPESTVKELIENDILKAFLIKYGYKGIIDDIIILLTDYEIYTIWDKYNNEVFY